jgi:uncharacterized membrane protein
VEQTAADSRTLCTRKGIGGLLFRVAMALLAVMLPSGLAGLSSPTPAAAQASAGLIVSPPVWDFTADPGETVKRTFVITNSGDQNFPVTTQIRNFTADPRNGVTTDFTDDRTEFEMKSYVTVKPALVTLAPKQSVDVDVTVKVPRDASPGGHFGAITFHSAALPQSGNVKIDQAVTALLLMKANGDVNEKLDLTKFQVTSGKKLLGVYTDDPITFSSSFENGGNVQVQPDLTLLVDDKMGTDETVRKATPGYTLPGVTRTYDLSWHPRAVPGIYRVKIDAGYGSGLKLDKTLTVVVIPPAYWVGLGVFVALLMALGVVHLRKRHHSEHRRKDHDESHSVATFIHDLHEDDTPKDESSPQPES